MDEQRYADKLVREFFYALPHNGLLNHGINCIDDRWSEANKCALIALQHIRKAAADNPKYDYDKVEEEINKLK